jgi:hypothetical protein
MRILFLLAALICAMNLEPLSAQTYKAKDLAGVWTLTDGKAKLTLNENMTFTYSFQGLQSEQTFKGTYKLKDSKRGTSIEFKRDNGAGMPTKVVKSLSDNRKKMELKFGTVTETYEKK